MKLKIYKAQFRKVFNYYLITSCNFQFCLIFCSLTSNVIQMIKNAYLATPEDMNIVGWKAPIIHLILSLKSHEIFLAVDWGEMAGDINYLRSAASTQNVGRNVAAVIDHMVTERNAQLEDIHVIGHSLGAHTAGFSGMYLKSGGGEEKVGRITGLGNG